MRLLRRILMGWRITLPIGGRRIAVPVILTSLLLCCGVSMVGTAIDSSMRRAGVLPTYTPRPTATATEIPTSTPIPTDTPVPTDTAEPTATSEPTATPVPPTAAPTQPPPPPAPTAAPVRAAPAIVLPSAASSSCDCSDNLYNCADFVAFDAQSCYLRCMELTGRDVHDLDRDHDGSACEWEY